MEYSLLFGVTGFLLSAYAVIANDSAQTLGTFIASNKDGKWYWQWAVMSIVMVATLSYAFMSGDISSGRLNDIPLPKLYSWYHLAAPLLLLVMTRVGVPVSTTILTLSVFSSSFVLEKILLKSALGYSIAAVSAYILWFTLSKSTQVADCAMGRDMSSLAAVASARHCKRSCFSASWCRITYLDVRCLHDHSSHRISTFIL